MNGNDSVFGTPQASRPGSPSNDLTLTSGGGAGIEQGGLARRPSWNQVPGGVSLEGFKRALGANANKPMGRRPSLVSGLSEEPESIEEEEVVR